MVSATISVSHDDASAKCTPTKIDGSALADHPAEHPPSVMP
jgi:hypothetical protein